MRKTIVGYLKKSLKTSFLILFFTLLVFGLNVFYNQTEEVSAYEYKTECKTIIPIGRAVDETQDAGGQIINDLENIINQAETQIVQAKKMTDLAGQCDYKRCSTGCRKYTYACNPYPCNCQEVCEEEDCWEECDTCWETCYSCDVLPCTGYACDFSGIESAQNQIEESYDEINESQENIKNIIETTLKPDSEIAKKLIISKANLEYCAGFVKITEDMTPEEIDELIKRGAIKMLLGCDSAKVADLELIECHLNDFFCCE